MNREQILQLELQLKRIDRSVSALYGMLPKSTGNYVKTHIAEIQSQLALAWRGLDQFLNTLQTEPPSNEPKTL